MKLIKIIIPIILFVMVLIWQSCCTSGLKFSGKVVDNSGKGIPEATVKIGEKEERTDKNGQFEICVSRPDKGGKYVLNALKLEFGFFSRVYADTATHLVITLTKATVVTVDPNQDISVQDLNPDISSPSSASAPVSNPLDTIPFVYDAKGSLVGFTRPQSSIDSRKALANFQPPILGAKIEIPAGSLVFESEKNRKPTDSIQISLNTIDVYSPEGMPGNFTVDRGKDQRAYMQTFGAANIEAYYKDQPLQLGDGKTATLTIPIDTLSIISKRPLPDKIPLLIYNPTTGYWSEAGFADINATRDAYVGKVNHFSTFNMDLEKVTPSCLQLCVELSAGTTLDIYPNPASGFGDMTWEDTSIPDCTTPPTDCSVYSISVANTFGVRNIENSIAINVDVVNGGTIDASYVLNSGPQPTGFSSPDDYQKCNWNDCAGPFYISNDKCWEIKGAAPTHVVTGMNAPVLAFKSGTVATDLDFTWIFVESTTGGIITNSNNYYEVEYQTFNGSFPGALGIWQKVIFDFAGVQANHFPRSATGNNQWNPPVLTAHFNGGDNPAINSGDVLVFRVNVFVNRPEPGSAANTTTPTNLGVISISNFSTLSLGDQSSLVSAINTYTDPSGLSSPTCYIVIN
jgi:hypothetical protein